MLELDKEALEKRLIVEKIKDLERANSRSLIREIAPSIVAILISIAAAFAIVIIGKGVVDDSWKKLQSISQEIVNKTDKLAEIKKDIEIAYITLNGIEGDMSNYENMVDFDISLSECNNQSCIINVRVLNENTSINLYDECNRDLVFPGEIPNFEAGDCRNLEEGPHMCADNAAGFLCKFGPYFKLGNLDSGIWVAVSADGKKSVRYIMLKEHTR